MSDDSSLRLEVQNGEVRMCFVHHGATVVDALMTDVSADDIALMFMTAAEQARASRST